MEAVIGILVMVIILWFVLRKTIRIWAQVSEKVSEATAREVLINVAKSNVKTSRKVQDLIADETITLDLKSVDKYLFEGKLPKTSTEE